MSDSIGTEKLKGRQVKYLLKEVIRKTILGSFQFCVNFRQRKGDAFLLMCW